MHITETRGTTSWFNPTLNVTNLLTSKDMQCVKPNLLTVGKLSPKDPKSFVAEPSSNYFTLSGYRLFEKQMRGCGHDLNAIGH